MAPALWLMTFDTSVIFECVLVFVNSIYTCRLWRVLAATTSRKADRGCVGRATTCALDREKVGYPSVRSLRNVHTTTLPFVPCQRPLDYEFAVVYRPCSESLDLSIANVELK